MYTMEEHLEQVSPRFFGVHMLADQACSCCLCCRLAFGRGHSSRHCKLCGLLFCEKCTADRWTLPPGFGVSGDQRVCLGCARMLYEGTAPADVGLRMLPSRAPRSRRPAAGAGAGTCREIRVRSQAACSLVPCAHTLVPGEALARRQHFAAFKGTGGRLSKSRPKPTKGAMAPRPPLLVRAQQFVRGKKNFTYRWASSPRAVRGSRPAHNAMHGACTCTHPHALVAPDAHGRPTHPRACGPARTQRMHAATTRTCAQLYQASTPA